MADDQMRPWADALAMVQGHVRGDQDAWTVLFLPYLEAFIWGNREPMANLVGALGTFAAEVVKRQAASVGIRPDKVMEEWLLWSAQHHPDA